MPPTHLLLLRAFFFRLEELSEAQCNVILGYILNY
jgi:hypothetical protein